MSQIIISTSNSSNGSKRTSTSIHDACIAFHMTTLSQIWTPASICDGIILVSQIWELTDSDTFSLEQARIFPEYTTKPLL